LHISPFHISPFNDRTPDRATCGRARTAGIERADCHREAEVEKILQITAFNGFVFAIEHQTAGRFVYAIRMHLEGV
jgi:hypothetical protein